jgi:DNA-binding beta-propeller fold protein YncE
MVPVAGNPFGVVTTAGGAWSFVSQSSGEVAVVATHGSRPKVVREIPLPGSHPGSDALSHNGRYLLVASSSGAAVLSVDRAKRGAPHPVLGQLAADHHSGDFKLNSAIEVAVSPDDTFVFVSLEYANEIAVFNLRRALQNGFRGSALVGTIRLGLAVVGMAVSPDGRWLYATSEARHATSRIGTISVIDLRAAETRPHASVVTSAAAGCGTVRVAVSPDGAVVWVTARESNSVLAFATARLRTDPQHALLARVRLGPAPVGLALVHDGARLVVAESNRFAQPGQVAALTVIDTRSALAGKDAVIGAIPTGMFPREISVDARRERVFVTNFGSNQLEVVDTRHLP